MSPEKLHEFYEPQQTSVMEVRGNIELTPNQNVLVGEQEVQDKLGVHSGGQLVGVVEIGPADMPEHQEHVFIIDRGAEAKAATIENPAKINQKGHVVRGRYLILDQRAVDTLTNPAYAGAVDMGLEFAQLDRGDRVLLGREVDNLHVQDRNTAISRRHAEIRVGDDGILNIVDHNSTNGTRVITGANAEEGLISRVPKSPDETQDILAVSEQQRQAEVESQGKSAEQEFATRIEDLLKPFSEGDRMWIWRYAAGIMNKRDAQVRGDGAASIAHGQAAGRAFSKLTTRDAQDAANTYLHYMEQLERVRLAEKDR